MKGMGDVFALVFVVWLFIWLVILMTEGVTRWEYRRGDSGACYEVLWEAMAVPFSYSIAMSPVDDEFCKEEP